VINPTAIPATPVPCDAARPAACGPDDAQVAQWTEAMVRGERSAYEALFRARCAFVERESARMLGSRRSLADDVAQEVWMRIARKPVASPSAASLDAWLKRVVRSAAIDMLRSELSRQLRESSVARERMEAVRFLDGYELLESLRADIAAIEGLTPEERAMFELKARTDATTARLAGWLGIGSAAVDSRLRRAAERARLDTQKRRGNP
jgi:RNA polymerase sigma-70 factor (ECF subfamily)